MMALKYFVVTSGLLTLMSYRKLMDSYTDFRAMTSAMLENQKGLMESSGLFINTALST